ncbi:MAG: glycosyltransferase [Desulforhabdus sp.]|jgi:glycosyltransferase involved in cell wall biosynthesis|nr:glycosyltransferase [Desulforhabdus sp.]
MEKLVSIIVPCFRQAQFLPDALDSVISQTYQNWECIVVNDGSPDKTVEIAEEYSKIDRRFRVISQSNQGVCKARNNGLGNAIGDFIQYLDADDLLFPEKLAIQVSALAEVHETAVCFSDFRYCDANDTSKSIYIKQFNKPKFVMEKAIYDIASRWETELSIPIHSFLFDARLFRNHNIISPDFLPNHTDWDCWMRLFRLNPKLVYVPGELVSYRLVPGSMSKDPTKMRDGFDLAIQLHLDMEATSDSPDEQLIKLLLRKRAQMRRLYNQQARHIIFAKGKSNLHATYRKVTPWPIQRVIHRFFGI